MPEISRFLGIIIYMYFNDHDPPHFHAKYNEYEITVEIDTGIVEGRFTERALKAVLEWHQKHKKELLKNWLYAKERVPLKTIAPLE